MGIHWYFQFALKTANNRDKMLKYKALKQIKKNVSQLLIVVYIIRQSGGIRIKYKAVNII